MTGQLFSSQAMEAFYRYRPITLEQMEHYYEHLPMVLIKVPTLILPSIKISQVQLLRLEPVLKTIKPQVTFDSAQVSLYNFYLYHLSILYPLLKVPLPIQAVSIFKRLILF